jgi:hypothetical protein
MGGVWAAFDEAAGAFGAAVVCEMAGRDAKASTAKDRVAKIRMVNPFENDLKEWYAGKPDSAMLNLAASGRIPVCRAGQKQLLIRHETKSLCFPTLSAKSAERMGHPVAMLSAQISRRTPDERAHLPQRGERNRV